MVVPAQAVTSPTICSGMLAIAACCMYFDAGPDSQEQRDKLRRTALFYYNACTLDVTRDVQQLDDVMCVDTIISSTRLLFAVGLAFSRIERGEHESLDKPECWAWLPLLRGIVAVHHSVRDSNAHRLKVRPLPVDMSSADPAAMAVQKCEPLPKDDLEGETRELRILSKFWLASADRLQDMLIAREDVLSTSQLEKCRHAIGQLGALLGHLCSVDRTPNLLRTAFAWPSRLSSDFAASLIGCETFPLIIYTHWLLILVLIEHHWIIADMGRAGIMEIVQRSMQWCEDERDAVDSVVKTLEEITQP